MKKTGMMATYPARMESLFETLPTILPQLDTLYIYCNGYTMDEFGMLARKIAKMDSESRVRLIDPEFGVGDVQDMGKFWAWHTVRGYIFLLDDDLLYPKDYTAQHIKWIDHHGQISTVHGRSLKCYPISDYFADTRSMHYRRGLAKPMLTDVAGTGTAAFHTKYFNPPECPSVSMHSFKGMADIYFATLVNSRKMTIVLLPRGEGWVRDTDASGGTQSLYSRTRNDTALHCKRINAQPWKISK